MVPVTMAKEASGTYSEVGYTSGKLECWIYDRQRKRVGTGVQGEWYRHCMRTRNEVEGQECKRTRRRIQDLLQWRGRWQE